MNIALWVVQILLAAVYLAAGAVKVLRPRQQLLSQMPWAEDLTDAQFKRIGAVEVLGAIGLVLPWATGIAPWLTPLAALGLAIVQLMAIRVHARRHEPVIANLVLLALALFVSVGRSLT
jgi:hypothetical protein